MKKSNTLKLVIILILLLISGLIIKQCKRPIITNNITEFPKQPDNIIKIGDKKAVEQFTIITDSKETIKQLQDSITQLLTSKANIKNPILYTKYTEQYNDTNIVGRLKDSLSREFDNLVSKLTNDYTTKIDIEEYNKLKKELFAKRIQYKIETEWRKEMGSIDYNGNIVSDSLKIKSEPFVVFGKSNKWYQKTKYKVLIGNNNPLITNSELHSISYIPKEKVQYTIGPILLGNKNSLSTGVGLNIKKGIFSLTVGYKIF